jgi:hypothetical protein
MKTLQQNIWTRPAGKNYTSRNSFIDKAGLILKIGIACTDISGDKCVKDVVP